MTSPRSAGPAATPPRHGFVMLLTGSGWGKSTAAIGYAVRARSRGLPTTIIQFLKGRAWNADEAEGLTRAGIRWPAFTQGLTWGNEDLQKLADDAWGDAVRAMNAAEPAVVVLDELTKAVDHGLLRTEDIAEAIRARNPQTSVIMTGRTAPALLEDISDTVTVFELVKHASKLGKPLAP